MGRIKELLLVVMTMMPGIALDMERHHDDMQRSLDRELETILTKQVHDGRRRK